MQLWYAMVAYRYLNYILLIFIHRFSTPPSEYPDVLTTPYLFISILVTLCVVIVLLCWIIWRRRNIQGRRVVTGIAVEEECQRGDDSEIVVTPNNILMTYRRYQVLANRNRQVVANRVINQPPEEDPPDDDYLTEAMEETRVDRTHSLYVTNRDVCPLV